MSFEWRSQDSNVFMGAEDLVTSTALQNLPLLLHPSKSSNNQVFPVVQKCVSSVLAVSTHLLQVKVMQQGWWLERPTLREEHGTDGRQNLSLIPSAEFFFAGGGCIIACYFLGKSFNYLSFKTLLFYFAFPTYRMGRRPLIVRTSLWIALCQ